MSSIQFFVVFHSILYDDNYNDIKKEDLDRYFTFVAVNRKKSKKYTKGKYKIINEWELPNYDEKFQEQGYNENSVIYHLYINNIYNYDKIGFFQYDMKFNKDFVNYVLENNINSFYLELHNFSTISSNCYDKILKYVIEDYENYRNIKFVKKKDYPMLNCYIIDKNDYVKIMRWVTTLYNKLYPWSLDITNREKSASAGHIGGIFEAIMALGVKEYDSLSFKSLKNYVKHK